MSDRLVMEDPLPVLDADEAAEQQTENEEAFQALIADEAGE